MKNKIEAIKLFKRYGFEFREFASNGDYLAFTYKSGFFHNAELVSISPDDKERVESEMDSSVKQLEALGFSTKKSFYESYKDLERKLFDGFFNVGEWRKKIKNEYNNHCKKILSALPTKDLKYEYIDAPFSKNNKLIDKKLIEDVCNSLLEAGPQLIIIEAPAGFGKTCTSYEIINALASEENNGPIPFFTEFSRDRQARVFNHIFVREVDRSFSSVSSSVVIEEVKEGRISVVLDGFDEILHDSSAKPDSSDHFEEAEPMLETIGELLTGNAKIILTSRKSAIFDGEIFNEWVERHSDNFKINRYRIEKPEVRDWILSNRFDLLSSTEIDISRLANPVLLSYLRFIDDDTFNHLCNKTELIVDQYFNSMLEREMDRQELRMSPEQQKSFLKIIAGDMCNHNYTSDSKEELIATIKEKAGYLINDVRKLYTGKDRPTTDKLATTLSNHAFFDRSSRKESHIEFINEFVFGNYIAENVIDDDGEWIPSDERFVEPAVMSYAPRSLSERKKLWAGLTEMKEFIDSSSRMKFEHILSGTINEPTYNNTEISSVTFRATSFFTENKIKNSVFNECTFSDAFFELSNFEEVTFLNCHFWGCERSSQTENINIYNCHSNNNFCEITEPEEVHQEAEPTLNSVEEYILSKIWPVGSPTIERIHHFIGTLFKTEEYSKKEIIKGIKSLKKREVLQDAKNVNFIEVKKDKFSEIKTLLGRS